MPKNHKRYMRDYMRRKRAEGKWIRWRTAKKEKSVLYRIFRKIFKMRFIFRIQKYGHQTSKTCSIGLAVGPLYFKMGWCPPLNKDISKSKWVLLNNPNFTP
jgi:hypothetical protein|tara:strand:- start:124 stop:426 length:303 start_codon:yes stop_codon:yes gene_type:complete